MPGRATALEWAVVNTLGPMRVQSGVAAGRRDHRRARAQCRVNTLGPMRVQQALHGQMRSPGGKVVMISTGYASIGDNGSGGTYAHRTSKCAVNMIVKSWGVDFKEKEIAVRAIAPGFVATEFGGLEKMIAWGGKPVDVCVTGLIGMLDSMSMADTGTFWNVGATSKDGVDKQMDW
eukprot:CAMPEP_0177557516 /NCGR_PEP_ID=MMETSP0369-20130122/69738_1 /TAXON_ID=447022 ORGANISM="Scrippsiella hangoei-like, Strain SHHI-4" /NCGR_SAMPLE_ID=MMETSP0369 /ASSEMBLY_ACC=CAM_ASM_000364 /LENGTH=175 /DNA_ID=CAMNT_0019043971 /DNA_START=9 /DNA_END=536 /DNA_ORIENTATION=-